MSDTPPTEWYLFGEGVLGVCSEDTAFRDRFRTLFAECSVEDGALGFFPRVVCTVQHATPAELALVHFDDPEPLDAAQFATTLFSDRAYRIAAEADGWSVVESESTGESSSVAFREEVAVAPIDSNWRPLIGNLALNRVLRLQKDVLVLHASAAVVHDRGVLFTGPKESGKTTLSTSLAARGHGFLGDELGAVRVGTKELLPFRRAISLREGPRSAGVETALGRETDPILEEFPDGTPRRRAQPRTLFPDAPADPATLEAVFVLRSFAPRPHAERFVPAMSDAGLLAPFGSTMWGVPGALRAMRIGALMSSCACYHLDAGEPDETADLIEQIMEDGCP